YCDDDLPKLRTRGQPLESVAGVDQREDTVDDWRQTTSLQLGHNGVELGVVPHRRSQDVPLIPEQATDVGVDDGARRRAAGHEAAAPSKRVQRLAPGCDADVVDDHVNATLAGLVANGASDIGPRSVDDCVRAERQ